MSARFLYHFSIWRGHWLHGVKPTLYNCQSERRANVPLAPPLTLICLLSHSCPSCPICPSIYQVYPVYLVYPVYPVYPVYIAFFLLQSLIYINNATIFKNNPENIWRVSGKSIPLHSLFGNTPTSEREKSSLNRLT